jgi:hypothetical protein
MAAQQCGWNMRQHTHTVQHERSYAAPRFVQHASASRGEAAQRGARTASARGRLPAAAGEALLDSRRLATSGAPASALQRCGSAAEHAAGGGGLRSSGAASQARLRAAALAVGATASRVRRMRRGVIARAASAAAP